MHTSDSSRGMPDVEASIRQQLSASAQQQLDALRATFDERVDALERALVDPNQSASLVPLVLDLTRVATEEAEAVARQACLETQLESQSAALAAVVSDRSTIADLRRLNERTKLELDAARAEAGRERQTVADAHRALEEAQRAQQDAQWALQESQQAAQDALRGQQDVQRRIAIAEQQVAEATAHAAEADERAGELEAERGELLGVQKQLTAQLDRAKSASADAAAQVEVLREQLAEARRESEARATELQSVRTRYEKDAQALAAEVAGLKETMITREDERRRIEDALREALDRAAAASRERDDVSNKFLALQQSGSAREADLVARLRTLEQQKTAAESAAAAAKASAAAATAAAATRPAPKPEAAAPVKPAPSAAPAPAAKSAVSATVAAPAAPVKAETAAPPVAKPAPPVAAAPAPAAATPAVATPAAPKPAATTPAPPKPAPAPAPQAVAASRPAPPPAPVAPVEVKPVAAAPSPAVPASANPHDLPPVKPLSDPDLDPDLEGPEPSFTGRMDSEEKAEGESPTGVFSTVADALRAWTTEVVDTSAHPGAAPKASGGPPAAAEEPKAAPAGPVYDAVRKSARHNLLDRQVHVQIDGVGAQLVDLSNGGAQVVTTAMLKPGRTVKLLFPGAGNTASGKAKVVWSRLEPPTPGHGMLQYRAGLTFTAVEQKIIDKVLASAS